MNNMPIVIPITLSLLAFTLPAYNSDGPGYNVEITKVYDADTQTILFQPTPTRKSWDQETIRLFDMAESTGVNAPEIKGPERPQGLISKLWVQEQLFASPQERLDTQGKRGKYGRLLGDILYHCHPIVHPNQWCSLAKRLVESGHAVTKEY